MPSIVLEHLRQQLIHETEQFLTRHLPANDLPAYPMKASPDTDAEDLIEEDYTPIDTLCVNLRWKQS